MSFIPEYLNNQKQNFYSPPNINESMFRNPMTNNSNINLNPINNPNAILNKINEKINHMDKKISYISSKKMNVENDNVNEENEKSNFGFGSSNILQNGGTSQSYITPEYEISPDWLEGIDNDEDKKIVRDIYSSIMDLISKKSGIKFSKNKSKLKRGEESGRTMENSDDIDIDEEDIDEIKYIGNDIESDMIYDKRNKIYKLKLYGLYKVPIHKIINSLNNEGILKYIININVKVFEKRNILLLNIKTKKLEDNNAKTIVFNEILIKKKISEKKINFQEKIVESNKKLYKTIVGRIIYQNSFAFLPSNIFIKKYTSNSIIIQFKKINLYSNLLNVYNSINSVLTEEILNTKIYLDNAFYYFENEQFDIYLRMDNSNTFVNNNNVFRVPKVIVRNNETKEKLIQKFNNKKMNPTSKKKKRGIEKPRKKTKGWGITKIFYKAFNME